MFDVIHVDLGGGQGTLPGAISSTSYDEELPPTPKGAKRFMILTDDYTRYRWFIPLKTKDEAKQKLIEWVKYI